MTCFRCSGSCLTLRDSDSRAHLLKFDFLRPPDGGQVHLDVGSVDLAHVDRCINFPPD
jgi:hypothetical protein